MEALLLGPVKLGTDIVCATYHKEHRLYADDGREGSYGLIVPKNIRDLLRGDDASYYGD
jgi:hypothetical protein